jgi:hypothetical protein
MAYGYQPGKTQQQVQPHDRHDSNEYVIQYQHVFVADFKYQGPSEQQDQEKGENGPVQVR